ncbi:hypothetical protein L9F63_008457 [Diploptera punctata]|uniref:C-type lectin domain-containing protein n=1 Tax=Diploptera punctata TaxID=6984 RepID=A0AAD7Z5L1_DIPPU|nr:hypothetical protein L9F63_008457 [Diploptera punctata]
MEIKQVFKNVGTLLLFLQITTGSIEQYRWYPGLGYYKLYINLRSWQEAERMCAADNGHLAIINSESESVVLKQLLSEVTVVPGTDSETNDYALIGFHDLYVEGEYLTVLGSLLNTTGYNKWHEGNPDNGLGVEDCGGIHRNSGKLVDLSCETIYPFICEIEIK